MMLATLYSSIMASHKTSKHANTDTLQSNTSPLLLAEEDNCMIERWLIYVDCQWA